MVCKSSISFTVSVEIMIAFGGAGAPSGVGVSVGIDVAIGIGGAVGDTRASTVGVGETEMVAVGSMAVAVSGRAVVVGLPSPQPTSRSNGITALTMEMARMNIFWYFPFFDLDVCNRR